MLHRQQVPTFCSSFSFLIGSSSKGADSSSNTTSGINLKRISAEEEPENMGALGFVKRVYNDLDFEFISRRASGSPATGSHQAHQVRQKAILEEALDIQEKAKTK